MIKSLLGPFGDFFFEKTVIVSNLLSMEHKNAYQINSCKKNIICVQSLPSKYFFVGIATLVVFLPLS